MNSNVQPNYNDRTSTTGRHNLRHDAEGAAIGGIAGHEHNKHHGGGPGAGTGAAVGAFGGHEYNKHHNPGIAGGATTGTFNNNTTASGPTGGLSNTAATGAAAGGIAPGSNGTVEASREARSLNRSGKMDKALGNVLCSTTLQQKGLQKQAQAQSMQQQATDIAIAENLEAQAKMHRGHAAGLEGHPNNVIPGVQNPGMTGAQTGPNAMAPSGYKPRI